MEGLVAIAFNYRILDTTVTFNMAHQSGLYFDFRVLMCSKSTTHRSRVVIVNLTNCKSNKWYQSLA